MLSDMKQDKAAQEAADKAEQDAADAAAAAEAAEKDKKTVPDAHPAATHIHDEPVDPPTYVQEQHEVQHFQADATAPHHIPMGLIASQISEGVKVI